MAMLHVFNLKSVSCIFYTHAAVKTKTKKESALKDKEKKSED
jgi:hypothetical protein